MSGRSPKQPHGRLQTFVNDGADSWKACWGQSRQYKLREDARMRATCFSRKELARVLSSRFPVFRWWP